MRRWLARQFGRPTGILGRWLIGPWLDRIAREMNRVAFEQLDLKPGERVAEIGFGGGDLVEWMLAAGEAQVEGVEISEAMLARARRRFSRALREERLQLHVGSAEAIPLPDSSVDKGCSVNSLYFWRDAAAAMGELSRILRPGGKLVLCFQTPEAVRAWPGHVHGLRPYGADEVAALLRGAGFGRIRTVGGEAKAVGKFICMSGELDG